MKRVSTGRADQVFVVLNADGGGVRRLGGAERIEARIAAAFAAEGMVATIVVASGHAIADEIRHAIAAARHGAPAGLAAIVVAGGDGSINAAAAALAGGDLPLGILPLGTFNHFARDLGLPLDLEAAARVIAAGRVRRVDVGEVNGRVFVNNSSLGIYPHLVAERRREGRRGLARWAALPIALLRVLWRLPRPRLSVAAAGWAMARRTPCLFIGNNLYELDAEAIAARSRLDRGELCVYIVNRQSRFGLFALACRGLLGRLEPQRDFTLLRVTALRVSARRGRMRISLDGESRVLPLPLDYRIRPADLALLAPAAAP